ncbi:hypothetical protein EDD22DRAFT_980455 [Suillus occidentalis]|nr:hypothetical protein EDD22DRAFT_980455 [Suillus occidentalis]
MAGRSQKRANQWCRWSEDVILHMIVPYLSYLQETVLLRRANMPAICHRTDGECRTGCKTHSIKVACEITIIACPSSSLYFFPCTPVAPSLAFVCLLFLHQSPNQTVWCDALETFLDGMQYKLRLKNSLWHHFSNVFHWYQVLIVLAQDHISMLVVGSQKDGARMDQPSDYLRSWCPLCQMLLFALTCAFTQKCSANPHSATGSDPPNLTPSFFLPIDDMKAMEDFVERCRRDRWQARTSRAEPDEDSYEEGMHIPVSVLNGCGDSFIAVDKKREKASTRFFTNTGLMALVCRHDHVLWIANLTSAGEKQHYALALLDQLFKHIPTQMTIGLLYDIGCQLKWSCCKWNFLDDSTLSRIAFAVAVFHVYGHQWACQIVYHPRKQEGFGFFLKPLIPSLCVSGIHCQSKKNDALDHLHALELDENMLLVEWKAQVDHQTQPTPHINKAAEVTTIILALEKTLQTQEASICELKMQLHAVRVPNIGEVNLQLVNLEKMKKDIYLTVSLNACTIKTCICDRLHQQKFELERLERSYRHQLHANIQHSIKHQEPGILKLITTYNDVGLDDDPLNPPAWLSDDKCNEEEAQLMWERAVLQEWMLAEWDIADLVISFHLGSHADELVNICIIWRKKGPSDEALDDDDESLEGDREGDGESDLEYGEIEDEELMDAIEEIALVDEYRYDQDKELVDDLDDLDDIDNDFMPSSPIKSLHKQHNM